MAGKTKEKRDPKALCRKMVLLFDEHFEYLKRRAEEIRVEFRLPKANESAVLRTALDEFIERHPLKRKGA